MFVSLKGFPQLLGLLQPYCCIQGLAFVTSTIFLPSAFACHPTIFCLVGRWHLVFYLLNASAFATSCHSNTNIYWPLFTYRVILRLFALCPFGLRCLPIIFCLPIVMLFFTYCPVVSLFTLSCFFWHCKITMLLPFANASWCIFCDKSVRYWPKSRVVGAHSVKDGAFQPHMLKCAFM